MSDLTRQSNEAQSDGRKTLELKACSAEGQRTLSKLDTPSFNPELNLEDHHKQGECGSRQAQDELYQACKGSDEEEDLVMSGAEEEEEM